MKRRFVLTTVGIALISPLSGCLSTGTDPDDDSARPETPTDEETAFEIGFAEQEGDTADTVRERILIRNVSEKNQYISGYTLMYSSGYEYTITAGLSLAPRSRVAIVTQGTGDSVAESDPPTYYRDANLPELVLEDGEESVRLLDEGDEVVQNATYTPT